MDVTDLAWIDGTGYNYEDYPSFLAWLTSQYTGIYGADVYLGSDSQDGQWLGVVAQALYDTAALGASTYNSFAVSGAQGTGLSRLVLLNGINRRGNTNSTVELQIGGTAYTTISEGIAVDVLNQLWALPASVTIPEAGTITVTATAVEEGAIVAEPDTVTGIYTPTLGWQTVGNSEAATVGVATETDGALRNRQAVSTSIPAQTVLDATVGAVANVDGVTSVVPYENYTDEDDYGPASLPPHSFMLVVIGGDDTEIAQTILDYKAPGTNTQGNTSEALTDSKGVPITISFERPTGAIISVLISIEELTPWVEANFAIISAAVAAYISAIPPGGTIVLTQLYAIAYVAGTTAAGSFNIESIQLSINGAAFASSDIDLAYNEIPICNSPSTDYQFACTLGSNVTAGAEYTNNGQTFIAEVDQVTGDTLFFASGSGAPTGTGTLTLSSGTGPATITFSGFTQTNVTFDEV